MEAWKNIFLSKWLISSFHVNLPGCNDTFFQNNDLQLLRGFQKGIFGGIDDPKFDLCIFFQRGWNHHFT